MAQWRNERGSFDAQGKPHSYHDVPADSRESIDYLWYSHGNVHRDGDKFARQSKMNESMQTWYKNDYIHRENDKPASMSSYDWKWYMEGMLHRISDAAIVNWTNVCKPELRDVKSSRRFSETWALYGCTIPKETFNNVMTYASEQGCPVWMAWFYICEIFSHNDILSLKDSSSNWEQPIPASWVFRMWGITADSLKAKYNENGLSLTYRRFHENRLHERGVDELTLAIINSETSQPSSSKSVVEKDNLKLRQYN